MFLIAVLLLIVSLGLFHLQGQDFEEQDFSFNNIMDQIKSSHFKLKLKQDYDKKKGLRVNNQFQGGKYQTKAGSDQALRYSYQLQEGNYRTKASSDQTHVYNYEPQESLRTNKLSDTKNAENHVKYGNPFEDIFGDFKTKIKTEFKNTILPKSEGDKDSKKGLHEMKWIDMWQWSKVKDFHKDYMSDPFDGFKVLTKKINATSHNIESSLKRFKDTLCMGICPNLPKVTTTTTEREYTYKEYLEIKKIFEKKDDKKEKTE